MNAARRRPTDPFAAARLYYGARFMIGVALLMTSATGLSSAALAALTRTRPVCVVDFALGLTGFLLAIRSVAPLARIGAGRAPTGPGFAEFDRSSLPRRVFFLLLAVAEADGRAGPQEKDLVRRFLLERFVDPITVQDLRQWEAEALPRASPQVLASRLATVLGPGERDTVFYWSCLVAFADGTFAADEHEALQGVARGLGIDPRHARSIFQQARLQFLAGDPTGARTGGRAGRRPPPPPPQSERARACAILGLEPDATPDQIRRRHRELVKLHHPDAQPNLGPMAQQEATERFRQIQRAYEILNA